MQRLVEARAAAGGLGGTNFSGITGLSAGRVLQALQDIARNGTRTTTIPASNLPDGAIIGPGTDSAGALVNSAPSGQQQEQPAVHDRTYRPRDHQQQSLAGRNVPFQTGLSTTSAAGCRHPSPPSERQDIGRDPLKSPPRINDGASLRLEIGAGDFSPSPLTSQCKCVDLITTKRQSRAYHLLAQPRTAADEVAGGLISGMTPPVAEGLQSAPVR